MLNIDFSDKTQFYQLITGILAVFVILIGCLVILYPLLPAIILGVIFALSTWPAFSWLTKRLNNRITLSAVLMTCLLAICFIIPLVIISTSSADNFKNLYSVAQEYMQKDTSQVSQMIHKIPYAGENLSSYWDSLTSDKKQFSDMLKTFGGDFSNSILKLGGIMGKGLIDLSLGVFIAYFFFRHGTYVAIHVRNLIETFGGERGQYLLNVSKNTLIGVVYGILGTALIQASLATFAFWITDVPGASFLGLVTFFVAFIPIGPPVIWIPVSLWLFSAGHTGEAIFLVAWGTLVIGLIDNLLRPYFVSRGSNLPFLLVLLGMIGGIMAFGFIGIFIGPTLLALAYTLVLGWSGSEPKAEEKNLTPDLA